MATLVVLAAGLSTRFGAPKQLVPVGPSGEALLDYALFDAARAGFHDAVLVIPPQAQVEFRRHVAALVGERFPVRLLPQTPDQASGIGRPQARRHQPWGTAPAVLAAAPAVPGPFVVCNADDFYGLNAYRLLREYLDAQDSTTPSHALVAYCLGGTLSSQGGVSRGIVERDANGFLVHLDEVHGIARRAGGITGRTLTGAAVTLADGAAVSMNLWGFMPAVLPRLREQYRDFLGRHGADPEAELPLSTALDQQVAAGHARVRVLDGSDRWFGMTFKEDAAGVRQAVGSLVGGGAYPHDLGTAFRNL